MHIKSVLIENVRGFRGGKHSVNIDFTRPDSSLEGWTVVAGRNGSGKTTFLRALALALAGPSAARSLSESFASWVRKGARSARIEIKFVYHEQDRIQGGGRLPNEISAGLIWRLPPYGSEPSLLTIPAARRDKVSGPWRGPWFENPKGWFVVGYGPFRRLSGHASDAQRLMVAPQHISGLVSLFREDASLVEAVQWLQELHTRRLEEREEDAALLQNLVSLLNDDLLPERMYITDVNSEGLWVHQKKGSLPLQNLSDGYRSTIAMIVDIIRQMRAAYGRVDFRKENDSWTVNNPGVVLIDEADLHLHVSWQQRIGFWLKKRFPRVQFIVSTHSPFVCQAADPKGLIRLGAPVTSEVTRHISDEDFKRVVNGSTDDAVLTALFGIDSAYSEVARKKRDEFSELRAKEVRGRKLSQKESRRLIALQRELPLDPRNDISIALQALAK